MALVNRLSLGCEVVLRKHRRPLARPEIVTYAQEQGLFSDEMYSRTPQKSMQARVSLDILTKGERSILSEQPGYVLFT